MPMIPVAGENFHYRFDGPEGAPVLMLSNSLGTDLSMWDPQIAAFTKTYRVLRYDSRGHGASPVTPGPYSISQLGRDALGIMDALKLETVNWCGLSKGGMVGQWLISNAPQRIRRAVLANTAAVMGPADLWNGRIRTVLSKGMKPVADTLPDRWFTKRFQAEKPEVVQAFCALMASQKPAGYAGCCAAIRDMDQREAIRSASAPVLVIIGAHDPATPPAKGEEIASTIKGAKTCVLDGAHLSNVEQPEAFAKAVLEFLA